MKELYNSHFQTICFSKESSVMTSTWKPGSSEMTDEIHFSELHKVFMLIRRHNPVRYLLDIRDLRFEADPSSREFASNLFKDNAASFIAIVTNHKLSNPEERVKGTFDGFDQVAANGFILRYYNDAQAALAWLEGRDVSI